MSNPQFRPSPGFKQSGRNTPSGTPQDQDAERLHSGPSIVICAGDHGGLVDGSDPDRRSDHGAVVQRITRQLREHDARYQLVEGRPTTAVDWYRLMTCDGAIVVIDRHDLEQDTLVPTSDILGWRHELGLPVIAVLLDETTAQHVARSSLAAIASVDFLDGATPEIAAPFGKVDLVGEGIVAAIRRRGSEAQLDPAVLWSQDVAALLHAVPDVALPRLAAALGTEIGAEGREDPREVLAATFFATSDLQKSYKFLQYAMHYVRSMQNSQERYELAARSVPLWVDLATGRLVLESTLLPKGRRVCGVKLDGVELAEHLTLRATASAIDYQSIALEAVAGENTVDELADRHERTLRVALAVPDDVTPDEFGRLLSFSHAAVFAVLDCTSLPGERVAELVKRLSQRLPGVSYVLVAGTAHPDLWSSFTELPMVFGSAESLEMIRHYVRRSQRYMEPLTTEEE